MGTAPKQKYPSNRVATPDGDLTVQRAAWHHPEDKWQVEGSIRLCAYPDPQPRFIDNINQWERGYRLGRYTSGPGYGQDLRGHATRISESRKSLRRIVG